MLCWPEAERMHRQEMFRRLYDSIIMSMKTNGVGQSLLLLPHVFFGKRR